MAYVEGNVGKIKSCGEDIITLADDFDKIINDLASTFDNITTDEAWVGEDADVYIKKAKLELEDYKNISKSIKELGNLYINTANSIDTHLKEAGANE